MQEPYFMNNQKISARQVKRTLTLELLGISTLLLPSLVATDSGVDGFFALTAGGGGAWLLLKFWQKHFRQQNFSQRLEQMSGCVRVCIQVIYGMGFLGLAGFVFYVMAALMEQQLLGNGWEPMILLTLAAAAFFGLVRGLESRVRVYEVLYWFLLIPLLVILVIACAGIEPNAWTPVAASTLPNFIKSSYVSFLFFSGASLYVLFLKSCQKKEQAYAGTRHALLVVLGLNLVIYLILLGVFRTELLAHRRWPVIDLMAVVKLPGNFLERQDALMVGIWFFCLFAFLDSMLYYAVDFFAGILCFQSNRSIQAKEEKAESGIGPGTEQVEMTAENKTNTKKIVLTAVLVCAAGCIGSFLLHREAAAQRIFHGYLYGVLPLLLILPVFCGGRKQNRSESEAMAEMKHSRRQRNF